MDVYRVRGGARRVFRRMHPGWFGVPVAAVMLGLATSALAAQPTHDGHFSGTTSQHQAVSFRVSSNGKRILQVSYYLITRCHPGRSYTARSGRGEAYSRSSITSGGQFSWHARGPKRHYAAGYTAQGTVTVEGHFTSATNATGTIKGTVRYYPTRRYPKTGRCSGSASFTATT